MSGCPSPRRRFHAGGNMATEFMLRADAEEIFFIMRGERIRLMIEHNGELIETILGNRDLISVPPGVYRGLVNEGREEALMCVMIGSTKPETPTYPENHPLSKVKRQKL